MLHFCPTFLLPARRPRFRSGERVVACACFFCLAWVVGVPAVCRGCASFWRFWRHCLGTGDVRMEGGKRTSVQKEDNR